MGDKEACDECKTKCLSIHRKKKEPLPVVTTFHKLLFGNYDISKYLYLPPKVSQTIPVLVHKQSHLLEDSNGQQWEVTLGKKNGALAFEKGWDKFFADHGLRKGYTLAFHYIVESHFVVQIIDSTGFEKLQFPMADGKKRKRRKSKGNNDASGTCKNISNNLTKKHGSAIFGTSDSEARTHNQPINKEKPSSLSVKSVAANGIHSQLMSKNKPSSLGNGNGTYQTFPLADCDLEQFSMINRGAGYGHKEDRSLLLDLSNFEMQCRVDAYGRSNKRSRPSDTLAESNTVASIFNENLVSGNVVSREIPAEVASKMFKDNKVTSERENMAVVENDHHRNYKSVLPINKGALVHSENRIKSSTASSTRVKCQGAAGSKKQSSENAKLPKQEPMELDKLPSSEPMSSGKYIKSKNESEKVIGGAEKDNEICKVVQTEPVDSVNDDSLDASAKYFTVVIQSRKLLELPASVSFWASVKKTVVNLKDPKERVWPVLYHHEHGIKALTSGWENFYKSCGLRKGTECAFVLENEADTIFRVDVSK